MSDHTIVVIWFIKIFSVYSGHLFLVSSLSVRSIMFLSFIVPIFAWNAHFVCLSFLKRSLVFPILLFSSISLHWSLRNVSYLTLLFFGTVHSGGYIFPFLFAFCFSSFLSYLQSLLRQSFCLFAFLLLEWFWSLPPVQCLEPPSIVLQVLCLSDLIPWICLSLPLYNGTGFDLGHTWMV